MTKPGDLEVKAPTNDHHLPAVLGRVLVLIFLEVVLGSAQGQHQPAGHPSVRMKLNTFSCRKAVLKETFLPQQWRFSTILFLPFSVFLTNNVQKIQSVSN